MSQSIPGADLDSSEVAARVEQLNEESGIVGPSPSRFRHNRESVESIGFDVAAHEGSTMPVVERYEGLLDADELAAAEALRWFESEGDRQKFAAVLDRTVLSEGASE